MQTTAQVMATQKVDCSHSCPNLSVITGIGMFKMGLTSKKQK